jgi:hypothetical protein
VGMVGLACPMYRRRGPGPDWIEYGIDSVVWAVKMPVLWLTAFIPSHVVGVILTVAIWMFALWPLFRPQTKQWIGRAYLVLIPIWIMYVIGWLFAHMGAVH